jgi:predicted nucleotide-binding protein (sugar kinase/HSP70/actin superfamily)
MKTSLRERWQEVVEEINRTNIPHIYLLTLDGTITENVMNVLHSHNITIVTYQTIKDNLSGFDNIMSFEEYFRHDIPHALDYWD